MRPFLSRHISRRLPGTGLVAFLALLLALSGPTAAQTSDMRYFRIGTGTSSGAYFPVGGLIASAITSPPGAQPCEHGGSCGVSGLIAVAQATTGGLENLDLLSNGDIEAAMVQSDLAASAEQGVGLYAGRPPFTNLRAIAALYTETIQIVVRGDSPIRTLADLRGHSLSVGEKKSAIALDAETILGALHLPPTAYHPVYLRPGASVDQLINGQLDALFIVGGTPFIAIDNAAQRTSIRLIPFTADEAHSLRQSHPFLTDAVSPAGVYADVPATATLGVSALLTVRADLDPDLVYGITQALWHPTTRRALDEGFPRGHFLAFGPAQDTGPVPLHPGAARFYHQTQPTKPAPER